ncbi:hypothetical protein FGSG_12789 [Fusarium graminearum PH-1]|uniref:hypothetical protein n=1 Tax=Gibberella zeae (strain ATCC MYA-4620 / CBS 123657 / FGSC 9075 / NRRL 31084 / PH-1) TaxID=229533 RepID=UPI00021F1E16|nr:hypothetical protein FGSG_12789 [Fusarium graminearum PH-1]ESU11708.1 hypothetical protein FGSG_12789 [Fusarium graminearum PH-1]|eukprot:XP_011324284.1 hypothetical protein FGSG_12789 [Fusarium graminearum PH-1]
MLSSLLYWINCFVIERYESSSDGQNLVGGKSIVVGGTRGCGILKRRHRKNSPKLSMKRGREACFDDESIGRICQGRAGDNGRLDNWEPAVGVGNIDVDKSLPMRRQCQLGRRP